MQDDGYKGMWWLPHNPDGRVAGHLVASQDGSAIIELQDSVGLGLGDEKDAEPVLLLGETTSGMPITLYKCHFSYSQGGSGGFRIIRFIVETYFLGVHFEAKDEIQFVGVTARFANLENWFNSGGLSSQHGPDDSVTITYQQPPSIKVDALGYHIVVGITPSTKYGRVSASIEENAFVDVSTDDPKSLEEYSDLLYQLRHFFSLLMSEPTYLVKLTGRSSKRQEDQSQGAPFYYPIEIVEALTAPGTAYKEVPYFHMLLTMTEAGERFQLLLSNWLAKIELLRPVYNLFSATRYNRELFLESTFLNLTQAVETYHRRRFGGRYQPDDEYRATLYSALVSTLPADLDKDFRQSLVLGKLKYANEFSLRKRLTLLLQSVTDGLALGFLADKKKRAAFVSRVVDTRNYLTHYDLDLAAGAPSSSELSGMAQWLEVILEICLLSELGIPQTEISKIVSSKRKYQHLLLLPGWNST